MTINPTHTMILATTLLLTHASNSFAAPQTASPQPQTALTQPETQALLKTLGIPDDTPRAHQRIVSIDANSLKPNGHILVVELKNACLVIHVMKQTDSAFAEIGTIDKITRAGFVTDEQEAICSRGAPGPRVHATEDGRIVVEVPVPIDPGQRTFPSRTYSFAWNGQAYLQEPTNPQTDSATH
jgi:hypothetical protein